LFLKEAKVGSVWYARFWDEAAQRYSLTRSTGILAEGKKQRRYEAEQAAQDMLAGIDFKPKEKASELLVDYLRDFWGEGSKYLKDAKPARGDPLGTTYVKLHIDDIRRHIEPFEGFAGITIQDLTPALVQDWQLWLADRKVTLMKRKTDSTARAGEKTLSSGRINKIMRPFGPLSDRYGFRRLLTEVRHHADPERSGQFSFGA
jgi:hypothetical protein